MAQLSTAYRAKDASETKRQAALRAFTVLAKDSRLDERQHAHDFREYAGMGVVASMKASLDDEKSVLTLRLNGDTDPLEDFFTVLDHKLRHMGFKRFHQKQREDQDSQD